MKKVTLVMVAKVAPEVLKRCLESVKNIIDSYVIVVNPGDKEKHLKPAQDALGDMPGQVFERPWTNVAVNRTEAFDIAKKHFEQDYFFVMDADDYLTAPDLAAVKSQLQGADAYELEIVDNSVRYWRQQFFRSDLPGLRYVGSFHEYPTCDRPYECIKLKDVIYVRVPAILTPEQQVQKYRKFIKGLEKELVADPKNARYAYYLAQSYNDAFEYAKALKAFEHRATMTWGWDQETWGAMYEAAKLHERLTPNNEQLIVISYLNAFNFRPHRLEPLYELARYYRQKGKYALAHSFASLGVGRPMPDDKWPPIDASIYAWRLTDEMAVASYWAGDRALSKTLHEHLIARPDVPNEEKARLRNNLKYFEKPAMQAEEGA
jgi:glycosyltransferase involved in cell wall biosynthesis